MNYIWEFFFHSKTCLKDTTSSVFEICFWVKKEFPNVTRKLISPPQAKKISAKMRSLWQVFSNLVSPPQAKKNSGKIRSLRQVFATKRENGHWDRKIRNLIFSWKTKKKKTIAPGCPWVSQLWSKYILLSWINSEEIVVVDLTKQICEF